MFYYHVAVLFSVVAIVLFCDSKFQVVLKINSLVPSSGLICIPKFNDPVHINIFVSNPYPTILVHVHWCYCPVILFTVPDRGWNASRLRSRSQFRTVAARRQEALLRKHQVSLTLRHFTMRDNLSLHTIITDEHYHLSLDWRNQSNYATRVVLFLPRAAELRRSARPRLDLSSLGFDVQCHRLMNCGCRISISFRMVEYFE